jgi:WD40 repeat protein
VSTWRARKKVQERESFRFTTFSPDGLRIASLSTSGAVKFYDSDLARPGVAIGQDHSGPQRSVYGLAISPDSKALAISNPSDGLELWDPASGRRLLTLEATREVILSLAYSPDGMVLAAGTVLGDIELWDTRTGRRISVSHSHSGSIWALSFSPDGRPLVSAGFDGALKLRPMPPRTDAIDTSAP